MVYFCLIIYYRTFLNKNADKVLVEMGNNVLYTDTK